jgi:NitT/TauT family transport system substrate-binding protein
MKKSNARSSHRAALCGLLCAAGGLALLMAGCGKSADSGEKPNLKVAYLGLTCEAPIFVAKEQGF